MMKSSTTREKVIPMTFSPYALCAGFRWIACTLWLDGDIPREVSMRGIWGYIPGHVVVWTSSHWWVSIGSDWVHGQGSHFGPSQEISLQMRNSLSEENVCVVYPEILRVAWIRHLHKWHRPRQRSKSWLISIIYNCWYDQTHLKYILIVCHS